MITSHNWKASSKYAWSIEPLNKCYKLIIVFLVLSICSQNLVTIIWTIVWIWSLEEELNALTIINMPWWIQQSSPEYWDTPEKEKNFQNNKQKEIAEKDESD